MPRILVMHTWSFYKWIREELRGWLGNSAMSVGVFGQFSVKSRTTKKMPEHTFKKDNTATAVFINFFFCVCLMNISKAEKKYLINWRYLDPDMGRYPSHMSKTKYFNTQKKTRKLSVRKSKGVYIYKVSPETEIPIPLRVLIPCLKEDPNCRGENYFTIFCFVSVYSDRYFLRQSKMCPR